MTSKATETALEMTPMVKRMVAIQAVVECAIPCHLMWMAAQPLFLSGYVLRADTLEQLNKGAAVPLAGVASDPSMVRECAKRVEKSATRLMNVLSPDDHEHALYCCAMFVLVLVDEGLLEVEGNIGILVAIALIEELRHKGSAGGFDFKERILKQEAHRLLVAARADHLYGGTFASLASH